MKKTTSNAVLVTLLVTFLFSPVLGQHLATMNPDGTGQTSVIGATSGWAKWSDDQSMIVFSGLDQTEPLSGCGEICIVNSDGSNLQQLTDYGNFYGQRSPRFVGTDEIWWAWHGAGASPMEIYSMNLDGSGQTSLTNFQAQGQQPHSIDLCGSMIYYAKQNTSWSPTREIYSNNLGLTNEVQLTSNGHSDALSDVSPDCTKLLMSRAEASNGYGLPYNIYQINTDGSSETRLTSNSSGSYAYGGIYSPDMTQIVYYVHDGAQADIWVMDADGSNQHSISNTPNCNEYPSDWQDGRILYYTDGTIEPPVDPCQNILVHGGPVGGDTELGIFDDLGTETWSCATTGGAGMAHWSSDLSKIVFQSGNSSTGRREIFVVNSDCTGLQQLTSLGERYGQSYPHFRNDSWIWWTQSLGTGHSELTQMNVDGSGMVQLSNFHSIGKQITQTFLTTDEIIYVLQNSSWSPTSEIYRADINPVTGQPDWSTQVQLTSNGNREGNPAVSPDGTTIVYDRSDGSHLAPFNIWVMNSDGSSPIKLTSTTGNTYFFAPIWSPDGSQIACTYYDGTQSDIFMMDADGGNLRNITNTPNVTESASDWHDACLQVSSSIAGIVSGDGAPLHGVYVDLFDGIGDFVGSAVTDVSGYYEFTEILIGSYTVEIQIPLGYVPVSDPIVAVELGAQPAEVNFELESMPEGSSFSWSHWWWKIAVDKIGQGLTPPWGSKTEIEDALAAAFDHFYDREDGYGIQIPEVTYMGDPGQAMTFDDLHGILFPAEYDGSYPAMARRSLLTHVLNLASAHMLQTHVVSEDGATASQALTYFAGLYLTGDDAAIYDTYRYMKTIWKGKLVPAGIIPLSTPDIMYKLDVDEDGSNLLPGTFALHQNYPNPFNPATEIKFDLPEVSTVRLEIFNITGQRVATLINGPMVAGMHTIRWDATTYASGMYMYRLTTDSLVNTKKMILLK